MSAVMNCVCRDVLSAVMNCVQRSVNVSSHELCVHVVSGHELCAERGVMSAVMNCVRREVLMSAVMNCVRREVLSAVMNCLQREVLSAVMNCLQREALSAVKCITAKDSWPTGPVCQYNTYQVAPKEAPHVWHTRDKFTRRSIRNDKTPDAEKHTMHADKLLHLP